MMLTSILLVALIASLLVIIVWVARFYRVRRYCPVCATPLPWFRIPRGYPFEREAGAMLPFGRGWWICYNCGAKIDARGNVIGQV